MAGLFEQLSGAAGLKAEGESAQNIANYNAEVAEQEAAAVRMKAKFEQIRQAKRAERIKGALTADIAKAGGLGSPVAADLSAEQAAELELENLLIGYEGEVGAKRAESQAILDRLQGKLAKERGRSAASQANIQFGLQLASFASPFGGSGGSTAGAPRGGTPFLSGMSTTSRAHTLGR